MNTHRRADLHLLRQSSSMYVIWLGPLGQMWVATGLLGLKAMPTAGALHQVERRLLAGSGSLAHRPTVHQRTSH